MEGSTMKDKQQKNYDLFSQPSLNNADTMLKHVELLKKDTASEKKLKTNNFPHEVFPTAEYGKRFLAENEADTNVKLLQKIEESKVLVTEKLPPPVVAWIQEGDPPAYFGTLENFSLIIGKAKSKKTFLLTSVIAAAVSGNTFLSNITGALPEEKNRVILFDTEQSRWHVLKALKRICQQTGIAEPENVDVYSLRKFNYKERGKMIEKIIYDTPNLGFVAIDGIRDLVTSINDEEQATIISTKLLKWTEELNIHIVTVLHQNKGDNNARGHLGTEMINKAETVLSVTPSEQHENVAVVESVQSRNLECKPFAFEINRYGIPQPVDHFMMAETTKKRNTPTSVTIAHHREVLRRLLGEKKVPYGELRSMVKNEYLVGINKAQDFITYFKTEGLVEAKKVGVKTLYSISLE